MGRSNGCELSDLLDCYIWLILYLSYVNFLLS